MANWMCEECGLLMDADDEGQDEPCPKCGKNMTVFTEVALKNFGGTGISQISSPEDR